LRSTRALAAAFARRILTPFVPDRKMLPFMCWLNKISAYRGPYLLQVDRFRGSAGTAIDIGANEGLFTYPLSKCFRRVVAFEINDEITSRITQYNPGNIELIHRGLSSAAGTIKLFIPVAHGLTLSAWGTVDREVLPQETKCIEKECRVAALDDFEITAVDFIKIDVEGHEMEVLKGAAKTIEQSRPIVLIEVRNLHERLIEAWFLALNYQQCRFDNDNRHLIAITEFLPSTGDCLYIPFERLAEFGIAKSG
jgi:FkbM family methyltransferase